MPEFVYHFLAEVATHFDDALPDSWLDSCKSLLPAIIASRASARAPLDMDVVHELRCLQSSSEIRITKQMNRNLRGLGLHLHGGDHFLDTLSCRRLALASCKCFQQSKSLPCCGLQALWRQALVGWDCVLHREACCHLCQPCGLFLLLENRTLCGIPVLKPNRVCARVVKMGSVGEAVPKLGSRSRVWACEWGPWVRPCQNWVPGAVCGRVNGVRG